MKKTKWITILLALGVLGSAAAGCAACGNEPKGPAETEDPPKQEEPGPEETEPMIDSYRQASGTFRANGDDAVESASLNAIAVNKEDKFKYGSLSITVQTPGTADNGIIFGLTAPATGLFWEGQGVSYYFYFLDRVGNARLGRTENGSWSNCAERVSGALGGTYEMKVERDDLTINCYLNGVLVMSYTDPNPLLGSSYGLRAGEANVRYSEVKCDSQDTWTTTASEDYDEIKGIVVSSAGGDRSRGQTLALHKTEKLVGGNGTLTANIIPANNDAGIVFGSDDRANLYYQFGFTTARNMELAVVKEGRRTVLASGVLSAGYFPSSSYEVEIRKTGGEIGCYLHFGSQVIRYAAYMDETPLSGEFVGIYASNTGSTFSDLETDTAATQNTADTLLFGHSYMEIWAASYKSDFPEYTDIDDIGIGGSVASHWEALKEEVISYAPSLGIYMIGINDLTGGLSPRLVAGSVETLLSDLHAALPESVFVLVGVNYCPARDALTAQIHQLNTYYKNIAAKNSEWVKYADVEWSFNSDKSNPHSAIPGLFTDGLHPTAAGYQLIAAKVKSAIANEDQPVFDPSVESSLLADAKAALKDSLAGYSERAYGASEWATAEQYYESMMSKIDACTTTDQLLRLDFSEEKAALAGIGTKAASLTDKLLTGSARQEFASGTWSKNNDGSIRMFGYSYSIYTGEKYTDTDISFRLSNNTGVVPTGGVFLRASFTANGGIDGYLVSYVTDRNYIQIYYVQNGYPTSGGLETYTYLGGWVYPGNVVGTTFYVRIEGSKLYLSDEHNIARYGYKDSITVDLTKTENGTPVPLYQEGYTGVLCWANAIACDIKIESLACDTAAAAANRAPEAMLPDSKRLG